jgi:hypothetical protein
MRRKSFSSGCASTSRNAISGPMPAGSPGVTASTGLAVTIA